MQQKLLALLLPVFLSSLFYSCENKKEYIAPPVNDYVYEYTTGIVSRRRAIEVLLDEPVPASLQTDDNLKKAFSISPKAEGKLAVIDDRKLIFEPKKGLIPGTVYTVTWDISKFFKTEKKNEKFTFSFETITPDASFKLIDMDVDGHTFKDTIYEFSGTLMMSDWSDSTTVHNLLEFDYPVDIKWEKINYAQAYDFSFRPKTNLKEKEITLSIRKNSMGFPRKELAKIRIPGKEDFDVYDIRHIPEGDDCVEVTFTRSLNPNQDLTGLIQVEPGNDATLSIEDNKVKIWFQDKSIPEREIMVHDGIKSNYGNRVLTRQPKQEDRYRKIINFHDNFPALEFIGNGGILPDQDNLIVPFSATSIRGVIVRIIKVYENNIGQFLQQNQLSDGNQLGAMGELLCRKIIFLDDRGDFDLNSRNNYALDMRELITPEPGALYRVILSYNYDLSAYPCQEAVRKTKRELIEENKKIEAQEKASFGNGNAYYYFSDQSWTNYRWDERNMPCKTAYYADKQISKNILYSDLGVIAKRGDRGKMFVSVNNLLTAEPEENVSVSVYSFQNQEIARQTTWENGTTEVELNGKEPFYIIARKKNQKGYLRMADGESLSVSSFNVDGEEVKNGTKGFIYTERGIWRPGDTIYVSFILNNQYEDLPERHPVTLELFDPRGQLYWLRSLSTRNDNFYVFKPVTSPNSPTGVWKCKITVGGVSFEKKLRIETIKPNRLSIELDFEEQILQRNQETRAELKAQWLTGAIASELKYDIFTTMVPMKTEFAGWKDYVFDDPVRKFSANEELFSKGKTDKTGKVRIDTKLKQGAFAPGFLQAQFLTKVYEPTGEFSINSIKKTYSPFSSYVGISSPQEDKEALQTNTDYRFRFATLLPNGRPVSKKVSIKLYKVEWYWWWNSDMSRVADYVSSTYNKPVRTINAETDQNGKGEISIRIPGVDWGTYYVQVSDTESGHQTGTLAYFDSYWEARSPNGSDKAMLLMLESSKESYSPEEEVVVTFPSTAESRAIITIEASGGILQHHEIKCTDTKTTFRFKATPEMQPNVYVSVMLLNPYNSMKHDLPIRLYGVIPVKVNARDSRLEPIIVAPEKIRPSSSCKVKISEKNGRPMTFTLGVVDEGLLGLTNFKTPSPWDAFFAKEALGMRTWDMYNYVLGAYGGKIEQIFSIGGDDALNRGPKAVVNRFKPVVRFFGPYTIDANKSKEIQVNIPEYIGKVRCIVVAGNKHQYGNAQKDILVKQPLMALGTLPRFLNTGDECWVPVTIFAMQQDMGEVTVNLDVNDALTITSEKAQKVVFDKAGNKIVWFKVKAKEAINTASVRITATSNGEKAVWSEQIEIQSPLSSVNKTDISILKPGESESIWMKPFGIENTNKGDILISGMKYLNLHNRITNIVSDVSENLELTISKAFLALVLPRINQLSPQEQARMENIVKECNSDIRNFMIPGGGFSYWPGSTSTNGWGSIYAFLYLNEVAKSGFVITPGLRHQCGLYQARIAREWKGNPNSPVYSTQQLTQAFRLFTLASANIPEKGAMNRLRQDKNLPIEAKWFLAAAYGIENPEAGKRMLESISQQELENNCTTPIYAKTIQLITFLTIKSQKQAYACAEELFSLLRSDTNYNSAETAFALLAVYEYYQQFPPSNVLDFEITADGKTQSIKEEKAGWTLNVPNLEKGKEIKIRNNGKGDIFIQNIVMGIPPMTAQIATSNGIELKTGFKTLDGKEVKITDINLGMNFIFEVIVTNKSGVLLKDIVIDQTIPAGWEIINRNAFSDSITVPIGINYQNYKDNKVISHASYIPVEQSIRVPMNITASYAGTFFLPPTRVDGAYQKDYSASSAGEFVIVNRAEE